MHPTVKVKSKNKDREEQPAKTYNQDSERPSTGVAKVRSYRSTNSNSNFTRKNSANNVILGKKFRGTVSG